MGTLEYYNNSKTLILIISEATLGITG